MYSPYNSNQMYFIKGLLSPRSRTQQESKVNQIFSEARVEGRCALHPQYLKILYHALSKTQDEKKCLKLLISKLQTLTSLQQIVKCFTIIHRFLISKNYQGPILQCIQDAQIIINRDLKLQNQQQYEGWFAPFYKAYIHYLVKAASNDQILIRTTQQIPYMHHKALLNDLFRLVNQLNVFLVPLNNTIKIIGRYYGKKLKVFDELYHVLQKQLVNIYKYFRILIDSILKNYEELSLEELQTFIIAIPQYELMLDQLQEILMSKYFKGGCKFSQPYVWAEDIAKINYHIQCRKKIKESHNQ